MNIARKKNRNKREKKTWWELEPPEECAWHRSVSKKCLWMGDARPYVLPQSSNFWPKSWKGSLGWIWLSPEFTLVEFCFVLLWGPGGGSLICYVVCYVQTILESRMLSNGGVFFERESSLSPSEGGM